MAKIYADLIKKGIKTIDDVPSELREEVERLLEDEMLEKHQHSIHRLRGRYDSH